MTDPNHLLPWLLVICLAFLVGGLSLFIVFRYTQVTETQDKIYQWGVDKFGSSSALVLALRMNVEVAELLKELVDSYDGTGQLHRPELIGLAGLIDANVAMAEKLNAQAEHVPKFTPDSPKSRVEVADVNIMLLQVMGYLHGDMGFETDRKMSVVRRRRWAKTATGKMQHIDSFRDVGTGIEMWPDLYYIISDSGSAYASKGFATAEEAADWMASDEAVKDFGTDGRPMVAIIPDWISPEEGWTEMDACNVVKGEHCRDFFRHQDKDAWDFMNDPERRDQQLQAAWGGPYQ